MLGDLGSSCSGPGMGLLGCPGFGRVALLLRNEDKLGWEGIGHKNKGRGRKRLKQFIPKNPSVEITEISGWFGVGGT